MSKPKPNPLVALPTPVPRRGGWLQHPLFRRGPGRLPARCPVPTRPPWGAGLKSTFPLRRRLSQRDPKPTGLVHRDLFPPPLPCPLRWGGGGGGGERRLLGAAPAGSGRGARPPPATAVPPLGLASLSSAAASEEQQERERAFPGCFQPAESSAASRSPRESRPRPLPAAPGERPRFPRTYRALGLSRG